VSGYNANLEVQSPQTVIGFRVLLGVVPLLFLVAAGILIYQYMIRLKNQPSVTMSADNIVK
jgi:Na+/melibiose symporter-like transporter